MRFLLQDFVIELVLSWKRCLHRCGGPLLLEEMGKALPTTSEQAMAPSCGNSSAGMFIMSASSTKEGTACCNIGV